MRITVWERVIILKLFEPAIAGLTNRALPAFMVFLLFSATNTIAQPCSLCELAAGVDQESIGRIIRELSGEDSVLVGGRMEKIRTRYTFSPQKFLAMQYIFDKAEAYGYSPSIQRFVVSLDRPELTGIAVSQGNDTVWAGSIEGKIFVSTKADGWRRFDLIAEIDGRVNELHLGRDGKIRAACKTKGNGYGRILSSMDGGLSWSVDVDGSLKEIYSLNTITFFDGRFGFAAGDFGSFLNTADGGKTWWVDAGPSQFSYRNINGSAANGPAHFWVVTEAGYLFDDSLTVLAAGGGGSLLLSEDGGVSWREAADGCPGEENIWRFALDDSAGIWTAGGNEVVHVDPGWRTEPSCGIYELSDTIWGGNVVFRREGWKDPGRRVILCGHYDSISRANDPYVCAPGADDNASGTACVLECARVLSCAQFERTVEFVLFDAEELGLKGSAWFAANVDTEIVYEGIINLDMVGADYGGTGTISLGAVDGTIDTVLARRLLDSSESLALQYQLSWDYKARSNQPMTDNLAFKGLVDAPAVALIESGFRDNPHYHNCTDIFEYVDPAYILDAARIALGAVAVTAGYGQGPVSQVALHQNYPNPFFSSTQIRFEIPERMKVELAVYDVTGRVVARLVDDVVEPDRHVYVWDGRNDSGNDVASGIYFMRLKAGNTTRVRKLVIFH